jgi:hypothetical protein
MRDDEALVVRGVSNQLCAKAGESAKVCLPVFGSDTLPADCASLSSEPSAPATSQGLLAPYSSQVATDSTHARSSP